jgi:hypothetical protein
MLTRQAAVAQVCVLLALLLLLAGAPILLLVVLAAKTVLRQIVCPLAARDMSCHQCLYVSCNITLVTLDPLSCSWRMVLLLCWQLQGCNCPAFKSMIYLRTKA